jgi:hypothetical protein
MSALNIQFTAAELAQLRERAKSEGQSMTTLVHDSAINCNNRAEERRKIWAAYAEAKVVFAEAIAALAGK